MQCFNFWKSKDMEILNSSTLFQFPSDIQWCTQNHLPSTDTHWSLGCSFYLYVCNMYTYILRFDYSLKNGIVKPFSRILASDQKTTCEAYVKHSRSSLFIFVCNICSSSSAIFWFYALIRFPKIPNLECRFWIPNEPNLECRFWIPNELHILFIGYYESHSSFCILGLCR